MYVPARFLNFEAEKLLGGTQNHQQEEHSELPKAQGQKTDHKQNHAPEPGL